MITAILTVCLVTGPIVATADAAPGPRLKQFRVPTADSQPRAITNGADGNRWFTEGTDFTNAPATITRVTAAGAVTEFRIPASAGCNFCIVTDIAQGPGQPFVPHVKRPDADPVQCGDADVRCPGADAQYQRARRQPGCARDDVWVTDFNNDVIWRYRISTGVFTSFPAIDPSDVAVDATGNAWFTEPGDVNAPGTSAIGRIDAVTGAVTRFPTTVGQTTVAPRGIAVTTDGQVWFTARFTPQAVGRLNPANGSVTLFPLNTGPEGIAAAPDGTVWFAQETKGNVANITGAGVITEGKTVKGSGPFGIVVATNGDPWYTMMSANKIATLQLP